MTQAGAIQWVVGMSIAGILVSCSSTRDTGPTIESLSDRSVAVEDDVIGEATRQKAIRSYREFLQLANKDRMAPDAMRRLADLQIEESDEASLVSDEGAAQADPQVVYAQDHALSGAKYQDSIELYNTVLRDYPEHAFNDRVLYQLARAYEHTGASEKALATLGRLVERYPQSSYFAEAQFRRGEILFVERSFAQAEAAYDAVLRVGEGTRYYEHAQYKKGWALFKQQDYSVALDAFMGLVHRKVPGGTGETDPQTLPRAERELLDDTLRAVSLSFSYQSGADSIAAYFDTHGRQPYEDLVYGRLGDMHLAKERYSDAAQTYGAFVERNSLHRNGPRFQMKVIEAYRKGRFPTLVLAAKKDFVTHYQLTGAYWKHHDPAQSQEVVAYLKANLNDLARHYHAQAQQGKHKPDYAEAIAWYRAYLESFPKDPQSPEMNFLLAEILFETGQDREAALEYERTAYHYPLHPKAAEAGYAALVAYDRYQKGLKGAAQTTVKKQSIGSALRFAERFPQHPQSPGVLTKAAEDLFAFNAYADASAAAKRMLQTYPKAKPELRRTAWIVVAHSAFDSGDYLQAESAYQSALKLSAKQDKQRPLLEERLAAAVYKQGEASRESGDLAAAVEHFLRLGKVLPQASIRPTAEYDAAAALIELKDWRRASQVLERFRSDYPKHALQSEVTRKLAVAYQQSGRGLKAAGEFERIGQSDQDPTIRREATWQAAELYAKGGNRERAIRNLKHYVKEFPRPAEPAIEARQQLAELYAKGGKRRESLAWLKALIKADRAAGAERSDRTRFLAANAVLTLAKPAHEAYARVKLVAPLKQNLKKKKGRMEEVLEAYGKAVDYGIEQVTTASTYRIGSIYQDFSVALLESEMPKGLNDEELEQYEILLEEQAYPFEEKAIEIHEVNVQRISAGVYDEWVKKSMAELAEIMPVRYAKTERSETLVEAIQ